MRTFHKNLENMPQEQSGYTLKHTLVHLVGNGDEATAKNLLSNLKFIGAIIDYVASGTSLLLEYYNRILNAGFNDEHHELEVYSAFIRKFAQKLSKYNNLFFTLCLSVGPPQIQNKAKKLVKEEAWTKPYFLISPIDKPNKIESSSKSVYKKIEIQTQFEFNSTPIRDLAPDNFLVFFLKKLGELGVGEGTNHISFESPENESPIVLRHCRPVNIVCSNNGRFLMVFYEDKQAELYQLEYLEDRSIEQEKLFTVEYLLPEFTPPTAKIIANYLLYQEPSGNIVKFDLEAKKNVQSYKIGKPFHKNSELRNILPLSRDEILTTIHFSQDSALISLDTQGRSRVLQKFQNKEITCVCKCNLSQVAIAFTSREIIIAETKPHFELLAKIVVDELPTCMVWTGESLIYSSNIGTVHYWKPQENNIESVQLSDAPTEFFQCKRLSMKADGSFVGISRFSGFEFRIVENDEQQETTIRKIFAKDNGVADEWYVIQQKEDGLWLWNTANNTDQRIADLPKFPYKSFYDIDGADQLLGTGYPNFLFDLESQSLSQKVKVPLDVQDIAGDSNKGFWLTDLLGSIYFLDGNNPYKEVSNVRLKRVSKSRIYSWPDLITWMGVCEHTTKAGTDLTDVAVFYSPNNEYNHKLKEIGRRYFSVADGLLQGIAFDSANNLLWLIWQNSSLYSMSLKYGTPTDFINNNENETPLNGIDENLSFMTISPDGKMIYILSKQGNLFLLNTQTKQVQAVFSADTPVEMISKGFDYNENLFLVLKRNSEVVSCKYIGGLA